MGTADDALAARMPSHLTFLGQTVTYRLAAAGEEREISAIVDLEGGSQEEVPRGRSLIQRGEIAFHDDATTGVLRSEMDRRDRVTIGSQVWSVDDEDGSFVRSDGAGMNVVRLRFVEDLEVQGDIA